MNLTHFKQILRQVLLLPVLALGVLGALLTWELLGANDTVKSIQRADQCIAQATLLERLIVDQETGLRGYEVTGDVRFLDTYDAAANRLPASFDSLDRSLQGKAMLETRGRESLKDLRLDYTLWRQAFAEPVIAMLDAHGTTSDIDFNLTGKHQMDKVRADISDIAALAERSRERRVARWERQTRFTLGTMLGLALAFGVGIGLFTRDRLKQVSSAFQGSLNGLQRRAEELFESEERLKITLNAIGDGVIVCSVDGCVQMMNPVAQELTGWKLTEAHGRDLDEIFVIVHGTTRERVESPVSKVIRQNQVVALANHTILLRRNQPELSIDDSGAPILLADGSMVGIVMVFRDVTIQRKTQAALLANEKLAVAGRLAATIAHEIHNPLDSVSNLLYLLRDGSTVDEAAHYLELAQSELTRVTQISRAMLSLYRESRAPVPINLPELLAEILLLMETRFHELGVSVARELPDNPPIEGFPAELRQVFTNLITNAAEAAGKGGSVSIRIVAEPQGATVLIEDSGWGIPEEIKAQLFQPFFTTKGESGTGLGLWVSRGIIQKHGGQIALEDRANGAPGTVARVYLATKPELQLGGD